MNNFENMAKQFHRNVIPPRHKATDVAIEDAEDSLLSGATSVAGAAKQGAQIGKQVGQFAGGGARDEGPLSVEQRGHLGGLKGGPERDRVLSKKEKTEIAIKGGHARWG